MFVLNIEHPLVFDSGSRGPSAHLLYRVCAVSVMTA